MAKITRAQFEKWNAQAKNGFQFDLNYFFTHSGEKTLVRHIELDEKNVLILEILYFPEYETKTNEHGCSWNVRTGREIPNLHYQVYERKESGCLWGYGLGTWEPIGEAVEKKSFSLLCKLSANIDTEAIIKKVVNA